MKAKVCSRCGSTVPLNARFCDKCGSRLDFQRQQDPKLDERLEEIEIEQKKRREESQTSQTPRPTTRHQNVGVFPQQESRNRNYIYHEPDQGQFRPPSDIPRPRDELQFITHSFGARVGAWFIDLIILYFLTELIAYFVLTPPDLTALEQLLANAGETLTPEQEDLLFEYLDVMIAYLRDWSLLFSALFFVYNAALQASLKATLGQLILKMRLVKIPDMEDPSILDLLILSFLKCALILLVLDVIIGSIAGMEPGQVRVSNKLTNTAIVRRDVVN